MTFPYISQLIVHNCYTYQGLLIPHVPLDIMKHIILTGKNGSGKTTILNRIALILNTMQTGKFKEDEIRQLSEVIKANRNHGDRWRWEKSIELLNDIDINFIGYPQLISLEQNHKYIFSFFKAHRRVELSEVNTVTKEDDFYKNIQKKNNQDEFSSKFKQFMVNKKVYQAFEHIDANVRRVVEIEGFFQGLNNIFKSIFKDRNLKLEFRHENFEFFLVFSNGRKITFNQLSEGYSAFLSIIMDLFMKTDLIRKEISDFEYEPEGIVIIDEPETHLHLSMQYEILPFINEIFPKIQLIVATHSPAIISSLENSVVFDLSSREEVAGWILGSSFSELMIKHFGLENEFSLVARSFLDDVNEAIRNKDIQKLRSLLVDNEIILTPSLKLEIESQIIHIESSRGIRYD